jgi:hypothetical protein
MIWLLDPVWIVNAVGAELRGARERKRRKTGGKVGGGKSYAEANPELVKAAGKLRARLPRMSLREVSAELASSGLLRHRGERNWIVASNDANADNRSRNRQSPTARQL